MHSPFTAALLAGGQSSRMGQDKATLPWQGQALWQHQIHLLQSLNPTQLLISGHPQGPYQNSGYNIIHDQENGRGPLGGLLSLLKHCSTPRLLLLAVDMPWMNASILQQLLAQPECLIPQHDQWWEGTAAVYPVHILPLLEQHLKGTDHSMQSFIRLGLAQGFLSSFPLLPEQIAAFKSWNEPQPSTPSPHPASSSPFL
jgi:molybdenum cofactor guanylyltransferase